MEVVFSYLEMLRAVGPKEWVFKEMAALERMDYDWCDMHARLHSDAQVFMYYACMHPPARCARLCRGEEDDALTQAVSIGGIMVRW